MFEFLGTRSISFLCFTYSNELLKQERHPAGSVWNTRSREKQFPKVLINYIWCIDFASFRELTLLIHTFVILLTISHWKGVHEMFCKSSDNKFWLVKDAEPVIAFTLCNAMGNTIFEMCVHLLEKPNHNI